MKPEDLKMLLETNPFVPFRIHLSDGKAFDIKHPDFVWVFRTRVDIAVPSEDERGIKDHVERCSLLHIVRLEELQAA
ncbi:MAG: hypothetical protein HZA89_00565 [Verrucomicrobia bacterium]|nr:hypothetical protein [Verrucomicrobiota bacterium]